MRTQGSGGRASPPRSAGQRPRDSLAMSWRRGSLMTGRPLTVGFCADEKVQAYKSAKIF